jgi:hypothetical protein
MQADINVAVQLDPKSKYLIVASGGYSPTPAARKGNKEAKDKNFISREHYLRWQMGKKLFTYFGLMDKVYGIRTADHTAFSRAVTDVAQNDQSHGFIGQYYGDGWELTGNIFLGNFLQEDADLRQKGGSLMFEYEVAEKNLVGGSFLTSKNDYVGKTRYEIHSKLGFDKGNSLISEIGFVNDNPKINSNSKFGGYLLMEWGHRIGRGYNLISQVEFYNATLSVASPDMARWTFGLLMFPVPRMEFRTTFVNGRTISYTAVNKDTWMVQTQLHLSL